MIPAHLVGRFANIVATVTEEREIKMTVEHYDQIEEQIVKVIRTAREARKEKDCLLHKAASG